MVEGKQTNHEKVEKEKKINLTVWQSDSLRFTVDSLSFTTFGMGV